MNIVTRFAPSPTGYLHIGSARTALFSYLYAKHCNGQFLLRIEDTDRERSTEDAVRAIHDGLNWLGIIPDQEPVFQFARRDRHAEIAHELVQQGRAYYCYCTPEELDRMKQEAQANKKHFQYPRIWRDRPTDQAPVGVNPVVRIKSPLEGETILEDGVQGRVVVPNNTLDDFILLRSDGTPTYMLAVVVDDHDMGVSHIIRGDDHLTNTFRQMVIYRAMHWELPHFSHIPLIHGADGAKLSKRHGALGVDAYRDMGLLPEAICNYLLRLGWAYGDEEIISNEKAIEWFDIKGIGKSPSRFDIEKLKNLNAHYIKQADNARLLELARPFIERKHLTSLLPQQSEILLHGMNGLKQRAKTIIEIAEQADVYVAEPILSIMDDKARQQLMDGKPILKDVIELLTDESGWSETNLHDRVQRYAESKGLKLGQAAAPLRVALAGRTTSPSVFEMMAALGKALSLKRLQTAFIFEI
ncbi:MAG: glutamate--tRNA ligase [Alphaproteobacteria bacterium]|nr:glutamate--tRNA ligase [Alphaproteobacteria bacterium]